MTVSVIIPCWRCSLTLERAIASIASQTYPALEVIAVDDASGDGTLAELSSIAGRYPTGWIRVIGRADNGGPGLARNTGWDVALGDYVAFLDADDAWHPKKLELHIGWLAKHPEAVLSGTRSLVLKDGPVPVAHAVFRARRVGFAQIFISTQFITRTVVVKREIRLRFEGRRVAEDFLLWARIVATGAPCYVLDVPLSFAFREDFDPGGLSGFLWAQEVRVLAALWRLVECGELSVVAWLPCFALSLCKYLRRLWIVRRRRMQRAKEPRPATGSFTNAT